MQGRGIAQAYEFEIRLKGETATALADKRIVQSFS
jgi:hypothetical protein